MVDILTKLVGSYRSLIGGADEISRITFADKGNVKDALKRAEELGAIIDEIIKTLDKVCYTYINYTKIKSEAVRAKIDAQNIMIEINEELKFRN
nr:hypothetical protein [Oceanirhabdus seepicola]